MKKLALTFIVLSLYTNSLSAQDTAFTTGDFKMGYGQTFFGDGLKEDFEKGGFKSTGGGLFTVGAYRKFSWLPYLNTGLKFKALGASPAKGDNGNEMFFNFWEIGLSVKYFPFDKNAKKGLNINLDYFFVSQFTQKYRNEKNKVYNHQFAIGSAFGAGVFYDFSLGKKAPMVSLGLETEIASRAGEVTGIGSKSFVNYNIGIVGGIKF